MNSQVDFFGVIYYCMIEVLKEKNDHEGIVFS